MSQTTGSATLTDFLHWPFTTKSGKLRPTHFISTSSLQLCDSSFGNPTVPEWWGAALWLQLNKYCPKFHEGETEFLWCDISFSHLHTGPLWCCSWWVVVGARSQEIWPTEQETWTSWIGVGPVKLLGVRLSFSRQSELRHWMVNEALWLQGALWSGMCARLDRRLLKHHLELVTQTHTCVVVSWVSSKLASPQHCTGPSRIIKILVGSPMRL